jgi:hypothetical protein
MIEPRSIALRVHGYPIRTARLRRGKETELVVEDPFVGEFAIEVNVDLELLELTVPAAMRGRLPHAGWRRVSLRVLIALLRCRVVTIRRSDID